MFRVNRVRGLNHESQVLLLCYNYFGGPMSNHQQNDPSLSSKTIKVLIIEDHTIVRQGLIALLNTAEDIEIVADLGDGLSAVHFLENHQLDIMLCDLALPGLGGIDVIQRASDLGVKPIALSMHHDAIWVKRAMEAGAWGYLLKGSGIKDLITAIRSVANGNRFLSPSAKSAVSEIHLSTREREVLTLVAQGHTSKEISGLLQISTRTVEHHRANIMDKLKINDVAGLTRYAIRHGLVDPHLK
jgi:DNA-binding NarL/FixJ family response regulator